MVGSKFIRRAIAVVATAALATGGLATFGADPASAVAVCSGSPSTTWTGAVDNVWSTAGNWTSGVPTNASNVCVPADRPFDPNIVGGTAAQVNSIEVQIGGTLSITQGTLSIAAASSIATLNISGASVGMTVNAPLTVDTAFNMNRGTITGSGSIESIIGTNFATSNTKNIGVDFTNRGTLTWSDGDLNFGTKTATNASGEWRAQGTADTIIAGTFTNGATFTKSGTGTETINADVVNTGILNLNTGNLDVPAGKTFSITNGTVTAGTATTLTRGSGTISLTGGALYSNGTANVSASAVNVAGGILTGAGGTYTANVVASSGAVMPGTINIGGIGTINIAGNLTQSGALFRYDLPNTTTYDRIAVTGTYTISSGDARVDTSGVAGNAAHDVVTYASMTGTYGAIQDILSNNPEGYFVADYGTSPLTLTALYKGSVIGNAFIDLNGNGLKDGGENTGRPSVTVWVDLNNNGNIDGGEPSTSTNASGAFTLAAIEPGNYNIRFGNSSGYARSTALPINVTIASGDTVVANAGYFESSSVFGQVFSDNDLSGTQNAGDTGAGGVTVFLDIDNDGVLDGGELSTTTAGDGTFQIASVPPGTKYTRLVLPAGGRLTTINPGAVNVTSGNDVTGQNFGIDAFTGSVAGTVYVDTNQNGTREGGETTGLVGETVFLDQDNDNVRDAGEQTATTTAGGAFSFAIVRPGTYGVRLISPPGYAVSSTPITALVVGNNQDVTGQLIGAYQAPSISGLIYSDLDTDGVKDANEGGIGNVQVYLDLDVDGVLDGGEPTTTTDATGNYIFTGLAARNYSVRVVNGVAPVTTTNNPALVTVTSGAGQANLNFGLNASGDVSGTVFVDNNGNGVADGGDGAVPNGTVVFVDADADGVLDTGETQVTTTAGAYSFVGLKANTYKIDVVLPTGTVQTSAELTAVIVGLSTTTTGQAIGTFVKADLTGTIFRDANSNGTVEAGDIGLAGFQVYIDENNSNAYDVGEPMTTSGVGGVYTLTGVGAGPKNVRVTLPSGATRTTATTPVSLVSGVNGTVPAIGLDVLGSIAGQIFVDANGDGVKNAGESAGRAGVTVFIDTNHNGALDAGESSAVTDPSGNYLLFLLDPGTYDVDVLNPAGSVQSTPELDAVAVTLNQDVTGANIGLFALASASGRVYFDENKNGNDNSEAGILKATAFVDENRNGRLDAGELRALTDINGNFTIVGIGPGTKAIRVQPWGTATQTTTAPADVVLQSGSSVGGQIFGFDQAVVGAGDPTTQGTGYWLLGSDGRVWNYGAARNFGSLDAPSAPAVGLAPTPTGNGYWVTTANGGVYTYGDAGYFGSTARLNLNAPMIAVTSTPSGKGYWLLAADGGVFSFGDAQFYGSTGNIRLNKPVTGMTSTPTGKGYWLVASDGGVFSFGDAAFYGSMGNKPLNQPVVGIAATSDGTGYWMVASDGGMFAFGSAPFLGTAAQSQPLNAPIVGIRARGDGQGYWEVGADGGVFTYGKAPFFGVPGPALTAPIVK